MSLYNITLADLVPTLMRESDYNRLTQDPQDATAAVTFEELVTAAEDDFNASLGAIPAAGSAVVTLGKPKVLAVLVRAIHARYAQQSESKIPDAITEAAKVAHKWAETTGSKTLAEEGTSPAGSANQGTSFIAPTNVFGMDKLSSL